MDTIFIWSARLQWVVLTAIATYLSLVSDPGPIFQSVWDKLLHVVCWFALLISLRIAWLQGNQFWRGAIALFAYSAFIEVLQSLNPARQFGFDDMLANAIGIALGYLVVIGLNPVYQSLLRRHFDWQ